MVVDPLLSVALRALYTNYLDYVANTLRNKSRFLLSKPVLGRILQHIYLLEFQEKKIVLRKRLAKH